jgi:hypothetical protein
VPFSAVTPGSVQDSIQRFRSKVIHDGLVVQSLDVATTSNEYAESFLDSLRVVIGPVSDETKSCTGMEAYDGEKTQAGKECGRKSGR